MSVACCQLSLQDKQRALGVWGLLPLRTGTGKRAPPRVDLDDPLMLIDLSQIIISLLRNFVKWTALFCLSTKTLFKKIRCCCQTGRPQTNQHELLMLSWSNSHPYVGITRSDRHARKQEQSPIYSGREQKMQEPQKMFGMGNGASNKLGIQTTTCNQNSGAPMRNTMT